MKNIILFTHGEFSKGIARSCHFILGNVPNLTALSITADMGMEQSMASLVRAITSFQNPDPTVVMTDLPAASTTQAAIRVLRGRTNLYLVSGLNLGLLAGIVLLDLTEDRDRNLRLLQEIVVQARETLLLIDTERTEGTDVEDAEAKGEL